MVTYLFAWRSAVPFIPSRVGRLHHLARRTRSCIVWRWRATSSFPLSIHSYYPLLQQNCWYDRYCIPRGSTKTHLVSQCQQRQVFSRNARFLLKLMQMRLRDLQQFCVDMSLCSYRSRRTHTRHLPRSHRRARVWHPTLSMPGRPSTTRRPWEL